MTLQFNSLWEFWAMAGHGPYVWSCYLITLVLLVYLVVAPMRKRKQLVKQFLQHERLQARQTKHSENLNKSELL